MGKPLKVGRPKTYQGLMTMGNDNLLSNTIASVLINGIMNAPLKGEKITFCSKVLFFKEIFEDIKLDCKKYWKVNEIFIPRKDIEENEVAWMGNAYVFLIVLMM